MREKIHFFFICNNTSAFEWNEKIPINQKKIYDYLSDNDKDDVKKRDKESVVGKLNPAGYPLIKIVVLVS